MEYWEDARFHRYLAGHLRQLLVACDEPEPGADARSQQEILGLLRFVASSGCLFIRNGSEYPATEARDHLQKKLDYLEKKGLVDSSEDFIARAATESSMSGKPYCAATARNSSPRNG